MYDTITIDTPSGPVTGRVKPGSVLFAGIPYAAPPVGELRFKPTQPLAPWHTPREATRFGPAAPQVPTGGLTDSAAVKFDEDCLTLNISTPACDDARRPVMVWIHGGGYRTGQSSIPWYNGERFSTRGDIVVVSINYRLGALGFADLSHLGEDYALSGVSGTLDQIAALRWVADNIRAYGGDPDQVTIAGESAGAFSVATLLGCDAAQGLFHRAIAQSGGAQHTLPAAAASTVTEHFMHQLSTAGASDPRTATVDQILSAQMDTIRHFERGAGTINDLGVAVSAFYPAHDNSLLPQSPLDAIRAGCGREVALLTGSNRHETTLWGYGEVDEDKLDSIAAGYNAIEVLSAYRQSRPEATPEQLLIALTTDHMFRIPAIRMAEARAAYTKDTWLYQFNWESRAFGGRLGATHALEIPFTFDNLDQAGVDVFLGPGESPQALASRMHHAWTGFISDGAPGWDRYDLTTRMTRMFDQSCATVSDPDAVQRQAWDGIR